jgi:pilus assembly protein CpaC
VIVKTISVLSILFFHFVAFAQTEVVEKNIDVAVGIDEIIRLEYKFNTKIQIGNESIVSLIVSPANQEITFRGVKAGKTSVTVRDATGDIRDKFIVNVTADGLSTKVMELRELIGDVEGIDIVIRGQKVIVEGQIVVPNDLGKINVILSKYPDVIRLIELSPQTQRIISRKMQEEINRNGMKDVSVRIVNGTFWLEGVVNSTAKKELAETIANEYLPDKIDNLGAQAGGSGYKSAQKNPIQNFITINEKKDPEPPPKLIKVSSQFVELAKDYQRIFGFAWTPLIGQGGSISFGKTSEGGITTEESGTLSGTISNLFPKLNSAKNAGYARIIQSGMVVTEENQQASINKTRRIPFSVGGGEFSQAKEAQLTFTMNVTPSVADKEIVKLAQLKIDVALPSGKAEDGSPMTTNNTISTNLVVKSKESAVIGGIVQTTSSTNYDKRAPGGQVTPSDESSSILFNLIRSKDFQNEKSQFVIFVTPEIIESASAGTEEVRKKFRKRQR